MLDPLSDCLDAEVARRIIALRIDPEIQARIDELADRCNEGLLTESEAPNTMVTSRAPKSSA